MSGGEQDERHESKERERGQSASGERKDIGEGCTQVCLKWKVSHRMVSIFSLRQKSRLSVDSERARSSIDISRRRTVWERHCEGEIWGSMQMRSEFAKQFKGPVNVPGLHQCAQSFGSDQHLGSRREDLQLLCSGAGRGQGRWRRSYGIEGIPESGNMGSIG